MKVNNETVSYQFFSFLVQLRSPTTLKSKNKKLILMAAIGGGGISTASDSFSILSSTHESRQNFVSNVVALIAKHSLDGIDIDWEFPSTPDDKHSFVLMLQDLKYAFVSLGYVLSVAVAADKLRADIAYDIPQISQVVDLINLMTYDFHGAWDKTVGHHAQMFPFSKDSAFIKEINCAASVTYWKSNGALASKLNLGIPTYGNTFVLISGKKSKIGSPVNITETKKTLGTMGYDQYCAMKSSGWKQFYDSNYRVYYAVKELSWFGFDSVQQAIAKAKFIKSNKLGGAMFWSVDTDDRENACAQGKFGLISAVKNELDRN